MYGRVVWQDTCCFWFRTMFVFPAIWSVEGHFFWEIAFSGENALEKTRRKIANTSRKRIHRGPEVSKVIVLLKKNYLWRWENFLLGPHLLGVPSLFTSVYQQTRAYPGPVFLCVKSHPFNPRFRKKNTNKNPEKKQPPLQVSRGWHTVSNSSVTRGSRNELGISTNRSNLEIFTTMAMASCWSQGEPQRKTRKSNVVSFRKSVNAKQMVEIPPWFSGVESSFFGIISRKTTNKWFSEDHFKRKRQQLSSKHHFSGVQVVIAVGWFIFKVQSSTDDWLIFMCDSKDLLEGGYVRHAFRFHVQLSGRTLPPIIIMEVEHWAPKRWVY